MKTSLRDLVRAVVRQVVPSPGALIVTGALGLFFTAFMMPHVPPSEGNSWRVRAALVVGLSGGMVAWGSLGLVRGAVRGMADARHLQRAAEGRCAACGYDLRATPGRCPECGEAAG